MLQSSNARSLPEMIIVVEIVFSDLQLIPTDLQEKWQKDLEAIDSKLGGTADKPISSLLIMLETPQEMVVVCTAGTCVH